jgi:hypothetical protein
MGWSPSRKLINAIGKSFQKPRHIALSDQTGSNQAARRRRSSSRQAAVLEASHVRF